MEKQCFCIQPFDGSIFDKRYEDVFKPAIESAGLTAYRVDRDPSVTIPVEDIENGIKKSELCFAEITTDNPNVWFELGYAIAISKNVIMVCSEERTSRFPFDIQHRSIIRYKVESPRDFDDLKNKIKDRAIALLRKDMEINKAKNISPVADTEGLSHHEMVALVTIMQNRFAPDDQVSTHIIRKDMNRAGFTDIAVSLALQSLLQKGYIESSTETDFNGVKFHCYVVNQLGIDWLMKNQDKLNFEFPPPPDIPF